MILVRVAAGKVDAVLMRVRRDCGHETIQDVRLSLGRRLQHAHPDFVHMAISELGRHNKSLLVNGLTRGVLVQSRARFEWSLTSRALRDSPEVPVEYTLSIELV